MKIYLKLTQKSVFTAFKAFCFPVLAIFLVFFASCAGEEKSENNKNSSAPQPETVYTTPSRTPIDLNWDFIPLEDIIISEDKQQLETHIKNSGVLSWFKDKRILPPPTDFKADLTNMSYTELRRLRHSIYAKNGFLTFDFELRTYFNQFSWYQPVFDLPEFKLMLTQQEYDFTVKIFEEEKKKIAGIVKKTGEYDLYDLNFVQNYDFFKLSPDVNAALAAQNFCIIPEQHEQLHYIFDQNYYDYIPNFVTTDAVQQLLQKHFSRMLQKIEQEKFTISTAEMLDAMCRESEIMHKKAKKPLIKSAAAWANAYATIAYSQIKNQRYAPAAPEFSAICTEEFNKILNAEGEGSAFLKDPLLQYSGFLPRGSYAQNDTLKSYFRTVKWLNSANIFTKKNSDLLAAIVLAKALEADKNALQKYLTFSKAIGLFAGEEDNLSLMHLLELCKGKNVDFYAEESNLTKLRADLAKINPDKIKTVAADEETKSFVSEQKILFTAGRYTFDAEIFTKTVHVLRPEPKRVFPKGLDVFAAAGNQNAEEILLNHYKEKENWAAYSDSLGSAKKIFSDFKAWNSSIYNKSMENLLLLQAPEESNAPLYARTKAWEKKKLITALSAWTQLKHNLMLYIEQPNAAQMGQGGGPPPPNHKGYVEPNVRFWKKSLELVDYQENVLRELGLIKDESDTEGGAAERYDIVLGFSDNAKEVNQLFREMLKKLIKISEKELNNEILTLDDFNYIANFGGSLEDLLHKIVAGNGNILPDSEKTIALTADVYRYNGEYLQAAVGFGEEIYVVVEINGLPYLTRGAVFSYYEFPSNAPLTDKQWEKMLLDNKAPARPTWQKELYFPKKSVNYTPVKPFYTGY